VAETIRAAEMERELEIAVADPLISELAQYAPQDDFRPASKLFAMPAEEIVKPAPVFAQAQPAPQVQQYREQAMAPEPAPIQMQQDVRGEPSLMASVRMEAEQMRMPKVEDFPPVLKAEIEHRSGVASHAEERGPMGLLKRLTSSLGRKEEEAPAPSDMTAGAPNAASQQRRALSPEASLYAPRRGNLDDQGRQVPAQPRAQESEEFDIPAFLRRQSN
jgi:cell division protein FtsZ